MTNKQILELRLREQLVTIAEAAYEADKAWGEIDSAVATLRDAHTRMMQTGRGPDVIKDVIASATSARSRGVPISLVRELLSPAFALVRATTAPSITPQ
jgi:hypothetical protein